MVLIEVFANCVIDVINVYNDVTCKQCNIRRSDGQLK